MAAIGIALGVQGLVSGGIDAPGTLDGGDVCECAGVVYVGLSARTNAAGADQLEAWLATLGLPLRRIDIRAMPDLLHLKSGMSWLGEGRIAIVEDLRAPLADSGFELLAVEPGEAYGANCVRVNDTVVIRRRPPALRGATRAPGLSHADTGRVRIPQDGRRPELPVAALVAPLTARPGDRARPRARPARRWPARWHAAWHDGG